MHLLTPLVSHQDTVTACRDAKYWRQFFTVFVRGVCVLFFGVRFQMFFFREKERLYQQTVRFVEYADNKFPTLVLEQLVDHAG